MAVVGRFRPVDPTPQNQPLQPVACRPRIVCSHTKESPSDEVRSAMKWLHVMSRRANG